MVSLFFFFQAEDGIRDVAVTGVQTCALPISHRIISKGPLTGSGLTGPRTLSSRETTLRRFFPTRVMSESPLTRDHCRLRRSDQDKTWDSNPGSLRDHQSPRAESLRWGDLEADLGKCFK